MLGGRSLCPRRWKPALPQKKGLDLEIKRFLDEVVGQDPEHLDLVQKALARRTGRRGTGK